MIIIKLPGTDLIGIWVAIDIKNSKCWECCFEIEINTENIIMDT